MIFFDPVIHSFRKQAVLSLSLSLSLYPPAPPLRGVQAVRSLRYPFGIPPLYLPNGSKNHQLGRGTQIFQPKDDPKTVPRRPQDAPRQPRDGPGRPQDGPRGPQRWPKTGSRQLKTSPRRAKSPQDSQDGPKRAKDSPKTGPRRPRQAQMF